MADSVKIDLARAKLHLRVDGDDEDTLIAAWIAAAYLVIEGAIFRKVYQADGEIPPTDTTGIVLDEVINSAALLIVGHLYANREATVNAQTIEVPMGAQWLLRPYINTAGGF
ncbi:MAG: head-tail connector protein [Acidovorax sp.]